MARREDVFRDVPRLVKRDAQVERAITHVAAALAA